MNSVMPDVANSTVSQLPRCLQRVGLSRVAVPILMRRNSADAQLERTPARTSGFVSLDDAQARGIHMSRIYRILSAELPQHELTAEHISGILDKLLESHAGISHFAEVTVSYTHLTTMPALLSGLESWTEYPVVLRAQKFKGAQTQIDLALRVTYSSTCPCSAALSRQLNQKKFSQMFGAQGKVDAASILEWMGTEASVGGEPHAQRSFGDVVLRFKSPMNLPRIETLASHVENHLGTPVQGAVKREDEQEFARLNARNLMFSEDAARRLAESLESLPCDDFILNVKHFESLHPYDVEASASKGVEGGLNNGDLAAMSQLLDARP